MRILLTSIGSRGDVQPVVALGVALQEVGHAVLVAAPDEFRSLAAGYGLAFRPLGSGVTGIVSGQVLPRNTAGSVVAAWETFRLTLGEVLAETTDDTLAACQEWSAELVVASGFHFIASAVAERVGARYVYAATTPLSVRSAMYPPVTLAHMRTGRRLNRLAWAITERLADATLGPALNAARRRLGLSPVRHVLGAAIQDQSVLLAFSRHVAPPAPDWPPRYVQTGYWFLPEQTYTPAPGLERLLDAGEPPVYVGFGSMAKRDPLRTLRLILDAGRAAGVRLLLGGDWGGLGDAARADASAHICGDVPHDWLFPRVAAVVHHGGAGTTAMGLRFGKPSLLIPHVGDQFFWGRRVYALGVGPAPIPLHRLTAERLAAGLEQFSGQAQFRQIAAALGKRVGSEDGLGAAVTFTDSLRAT